MYSLYEAFSTIKTEEEFQAFLRDICTPEEMQNLECRWKVAQMLDKGNMSYREIMKEVKCSIVTVTRVARFLNQENNKGYKKALSALKDIHHA